MVFDSKDEERVAILLRSLGIPTREEESKKPIGDRIDKLGDFISLIINFKSLADPTAFFLPSVPPKTAKLDICRRFGDVSVSNSG